MLFGLCRRFVGYVGLVGTNWKLRQEEYEPATNLQFSLPPVPRLQNTLNLPFEAHRPPCGFIFLSQGRRTGSDNGNSTSTINWQRKLSFSWCPPWAMFWRFELLAFIEGERETATNLQATNPCEYACVSSDLAPFLCAPPHQTCQISGGTPMLKFTLS